MDLRTGVLDIGYTHYWRVSKHLTRNEWKKFCGAVRIVLDSNSNVVPLWVEYDQPNTAPVVSDSLVRFNGPGDLGHETFLVGFDETDFHFCKTAGKPYDLIVCLCLLCLKAAAPTKVALSSDGRLVEWEDAIAAYVKLFGSTPDMAFLHRDT